MIVDSSALVSVIFEESDSPALMASLETATTLAMSAATYLETGVVVDRRSRGVLSRELDILLDYLNVQIVPVDIEQAKVARQAYRDFGRGSGHPARLNFGDCFSYALAVVRREPLLFKGDDFAHTDVRSALAGRQ